MQLISAQSCSDRAVSEYRIPSENRALRFSLAAYAFFAR
jgi:hypothetical protein